jgi:phosphoribosylformimino-5-aminoimidazole carboxamide ribotide isomerase
MRIIGVLDLMDGQVVRGVAGRRGDYQPIVSRLCSTAEPRAVALALRRHFGLNELYLADLDAIAGHPPALAVYEDLLREGFRLRVDAGLTGGAQARILTRTGVEIVAGLETVTGPTGLAEILAEQPDRCLFSLDLRDGQPLGILDGWKQPTARGIAEESIRLGVKRLLVLDLARVGVGGGTGTEELCRTLIADHPNVEVMAGGGVRGMDDLLRLQTVGVSAVLVSSALHDGRLAPEELRCWVGRCAE